jgi:hypothetical protein
MCIPLATTTYDTELDTICTGVGAGVDGAAGTAPAALLKEAAIMIAAGTAWIGMANRPGYAESFVAVGVTVGGMNKDGAIDLVKTGWQILLPYCGQKVAAEAAEAAFAAALAAARDDDVAAQADAELLKLQNEAGESGSRKLLLDSQELKTDAEKLLVDAQTAIAVSEELRIDALTALLVKEALTEVEKALGVVASAALSTALSLESAQRTAAKTIEVTRLTRAETLVDDSAECDSTTDDYLFTMTSGEYTR